ncbi:MAG: hypothetical protein H6R14_315 [Proteobacteria bacterium]|nr:hypothetical protein [Pseudomonadota bacterium]
MLGWIGKAGLLFGMMASAMAADGVKSMADESRTVASQLVAQIRGELVKELERTGPIRAITVCKYSVPEITSSLSRQTGMRVTRVSLRARNKSLGEPDVWEQKALLDFEKRVAKGEKVESLELQELVDEPIGRYFRYMKAIPMSAACLPCHGPVNQISEGVRAQLATEYPLDRAYEYQVGQVRGAVSIKKLLSGKD